MLSSAPVVFGVIHCSSLMTQELTPGDHEVAFQFAREGLAQYNHSLLKCKQVWQPRARVAHVVEAYRGLLQRKRLAASRVDVR